MGYIIRLLLKSQGQLRERAKKARGFTLIELLVALVIASIMISALLGFMVDILTTDRKEQARSNTEQEIQGAIDYIRRDLEQAVYIYDADGLAAITGDYETTECVDGLVAPPTDYSPPGSCSQIPPAITEERVPVLAFWKRKFLSKDQRVTISSGSQYVGCLVYISGDDDVCNDQDYQVYSLVVYYLMKGGSDIWSGAMRIGRFEVRDGIEDENGTVRDANRDEVDTVYGGETEVEYDLLPSTGFMVFNLGVEGDTLREKMNRWQKHADEYTNNVVVLVDYIDQTITDVDTDLDPVNCSTAMATGTGGYVPQQVPDYASLPDDFDDFKTGSFYACVDSERTVAQVYIRGNALARIKASGDTAGYTYSDRDFTFFPTTRIQVQGRGLIIP